MDTSALAIGRTYFRLTFADADLTMPGVEPLVFLGQAADDSGAQGFVFQDTVSYVRYGSGLEGDEQHEDIALYFMADEDARSLSDIGKLAMEVTEAAQRAVSLDFPVLPVLRDRWEEK
jgi:hypothetical protein